jgi:hypothetical protein
VHQNNSFVLSNFFFVGRCHCIVGPFLVTLVLTPFCFVLQLVQCQKKTTVKVKKMDDSDAAAVGISNPVAAAKREEEEDTGSSSLELRPVFLGNLRTGYSTEDVIAIFERPPMSDKHDPIPVDRIDLKRGYCFVFLKDATSQAQKDKAERYVSEMNGM